jgi:hypothetical protein
MTLQEAFAVSAGSAFARQLALGDLMGDGEGRWDLNVQAGTIAIANLGSFPIQLLGSHSEYDNTWLWAWANRQSNLPEHVLTACDQLRTLGHKHDIKELTERKFALESVTDHMLAMACGELAGGLCYYRAPYEGGAAFVLLEQAPESVGAPVSAARVTTVLMQVISNFDVDHRSMADHFLRQQGFAIRAVSDAIQAERQADGAAVEVSFSERGLISGVQGIIRPQQPKKPWWQLW